MYEWTGDLNLITRNSPLFLSSLQALIDFLFIAAAGKVTMSKATQERLVFVTYFMLHLNMGKKNLKEHELTVSMQYARK